MTFYSYNTPGEIMGQKQVSSYIWNREPKTHQRHKVTQLREQDLRSEVSQLKPVVLSCLDFLVQENF